MLSIIVAKAKNNVIGKDNRLIWKIPDDLKRFKKITTGHTIIMGRKTFESLGRILPNRKHIILSQNKEYVIKDENVEVVHSITDIQKYIETDEEIFVIGGSMIYNLLFPYVKKLYITEIDKSFEGDSYFTVTDLEQWKEVTREEGPKDDINDFKYEYVVYEKKNF